jgi:hypothetical protein
MYGTTLPSQPWPQSKEASILCPQLFSNLRFLGSVVRPSRPVLSNFFFLAYQSQCATFTRTNVTVQDMYSTCTVMYCYYIQDTGLLACFAGWNVASTTVVTSLI